MKVFSNAENVFWPTIHILVVVAIHVMLYVRMYKQRLQLLLSDIIAMLTFDSRVIRILFRIWPPVIDDVSIICCSLTVLSVSSRGCSLT